MEPDLQAQKDLILKEFQSRLEYFQQKKVDLMKRIRKAIDAEKIRKKLGLPE